MNKVLAKFFILTVLAAAWPMHMYAMASPDDAADFQIVEEVIEPADSTAAQFFVSAPLSVFPTVDPMTRLDMIDYFQAGSDKPSRNTAGGECRILKETPESITFTTSEVSEYTLSLIPSKKKGEPILMVVRTLKTPAEDSTAKFYSADWKELTGLFEVPQLHDWLNDEGRKQQKDVENAVPFVLAKLTYSPSNQSLTLTNNLDDYIPTDLLGLAHNSLHRQLLFRWNGKKFVIEKQK